MTQILTPATDQQSRFHSGFLFVAPPAEPVNSAFHFLPNLAGIVEMQRIDNIIENCRSGHWVLDFAHAASLLLSR
ncbi:hypothetical protein, partial [Salmonella enterica]|uniref:hypothetical protein n=1 Tax=Salmonella enterica TaxID=28901 RepID=UPI001CB6EA0F